MLDRQVKDVMAVVWQPAWNLLKVSNGLQVTQLNSIPSGRMSLIAVPSTAIADLPDGERWCAGPSLVNPGQREIA
jgi:hypothetical protein